MLSEGRMAIAIEQRLSIAPEDLIATMARPDTLLTGSLMAMIAVALMFDDDDRPPAPSPDSDGEPDLELTDTVRPRRSR